MEKQHIKNRVGSPFNRQDITRLLLTIGFTSSTLLLGSCSNAFGPEATRVAENADETFGCQNFEDKLWMSFNAHIEETGKPPSATAIEAAFERTLSQSKRLKLMSLKSQETMVSLTTELAKVVATRDASVDAQSEPSSTNKPNLSAQQPRSTDSWLERTAQLEIGDRTTPEKSADVDRVRAIFAGLAEVANQENAILKSSCASPSPTPEQNSESALLDSWRNTESAPVYGGLKTFAVAYQSCEAATQAPIGPETPSVQGIAIVGRHSSGNGNVRVIRDLSRLIRSHPYLKTYQQPLAVCHDPTQKPLIYDFGGKPFSSTSNEKLVDLFRDAGTGSSELGIDCSAFVATAYAVSGLKLRAESSLKASLIRGVSSSMLTEPEENGLTCLEHASWTSLATLKPGDLIAIKGHVIMVEDVGADPLGIEKIATRSQCKIENIDVRNFQFTLLHSGPNKGGVGINRMLARQYLTNSGTMGLGVREHAVNACKAKFDGPNPTKSSSSNASIIRHKNSAKCRDTALTLAKEECLSSCVVKSVN